VPILCLALFEEKLSKLLYRLNISRISGIRPDTGYPANKKDRIIRPDIRLAGYPVHPYKKDIKSYHYQRSETNNCVSIKFGSVADPD
jgi:hypothetical protein